MSDDIGDLFVPLDGPAQPMMYRQGTIVEFDPETLRNKVLVGGAVMADVPFLGVAEAASLVVDSKVGIAVVGNSWAIVGRFVVPGTAQAIEAVSLLSNRIYTKSVATAQSTTSTSFTDLATPGPSVNALIGASGRALVLLTSAFENLLSTTTIRSANVVYAVTGATTVTPTDVSKGAYHQAKVGASTGDFGGRYTAVAVEEGLTPGVNVFTAKYSSGNGESVVFADRNITVFAL